MHNIEDSISSANWQELENSLIQIVIQALETMCSLSTISREELELNKKFVHLVWHKRADLSPFIHLMPDTSTYSGKENDPSNAKKPEFAWFIDYAKTPPIVYNIECKRLLVPKSGWCNYYVQGGMARFVSKSHCYSSNCEKGMMVGYVLDLDFKDAFDSINSYANKNGYENMQLIDSWNEKGISRLEQFFAKREFEPKPFYLRHFWVDLR